MLELINSVLAIGLEQSSTQLKAAEVLWKKGKPTIKNLLRFSLPMDEANVKRLYRNHPYLITALEGSDVLVRHLQLPLTKLKDIDAALAFQAEPLLPYLADQAVLARKILSQSGDSTEIILFSARKDLVQKHLDQWKELKIEPENVSCSQEALYQFGQHYMQKEQPYLILHIDEKSMTGILIQDQQIGACYTHQEGLQSLYPLFSEGQQPDEPNSPLTDSLKKLLQTAGKMSYALTKELKGDKLEGFILTGEGVYAQGLDQMLAEKLNLPLLECLPTSDSFSSQEKQYFAITLGLALTAQAKSQEIINFRQEELSYPHPWKRIQFPAATYVLLMIVLSVLFYFFGQHYLGYKEDRLKEDYVELLNAMNKSHESFEWAFQAKNPEAREKYNGEAVNVIHFSRQDLLDRLEFLQKDLQTTPDSFPLFANIPRVADVFAWLSHHPLVVSKNVDGTLEPRLQLESFNYVMLKRPVQGKKQEKYQVKVELEFSSPTPTWAREFHDALIAPNDLVDPKGEVKWSSNRGRYRTSFYLKDKTSYPSQ